MEEINDTPILEKIEQKLDSMRQSEKLHVIGDLACEMFIHFHVDPSEEVEEIGDCIRREGEHMGDDAIVLLKKIVNSLWLGDEIE